MPSSTYETRTDSVLAWKRANQLGRFDPSAPSASDLATQRHERDTSFISSRAITTGKRCRVGESDARRGVVRYVGAVVEIEKEKGALWVGVAFDEPVGKNDGSINGTRYWGTAEEGAKHGVFVRPERVEIGDWPILNDLEDMEEI